MRWYDACTPGRVDLYSGNGSLTFSAMAAYFIGAVLAALIRVHILVLRRLLYANAQRAEYFADYLAAQVAGTPAVLSLMDKSHLQGLYRNAVQVATRKEDRNSLRSSTPGSGNAGTGVGQDSPHRAPGHRGRG